MKTAPIPAAQRGNVICIIGMHRSGTSMVARLLNLCGLDLGPLEDLLEPNEGNPGGYFENQGILNIDDALLAHFDGSWDYPPVLKEGWERDPSLGHLIDEARSLLEGFATSAHWGWKDPRTTILLPFWKSLIPGLRFVICVRNPLEVARSLAARDGMATQQSVYLWNHYLKAAMRDTEGCARTFTFYEDFFDSAPCEINRLAEFCGFESPADLAAVQAAISPDARHHTSVTSDIWTDDRLPAEYKLCYIGVRALTAHGVLRSTSAAEREALVSDSISNVLRLLDELHDEQAVVRLQSALADKDQEIIGLHATVQYLVQHSGNLGRLVAEKDQQIASVTEHAGNLERLVSERDQHIAGLGEHTANLERIVAERDRHIAGLGEHTANLERIVAERDQHIVGLQEDAANLEVIVTDLRRFQGRVKGTFIYKLYRLLRLHRLLNRSAGT